MVSSFIDTAARLPSSVPTFACMALEDCRPSYPKFSRNSSTVIPSNSRLAWMRSAKLPLCSTGGFSSSSTTDSVRSIDVDASDAELSLRGRNDSSSSGISSSRASSSFASSFASWICEDRCRLARAAMLLLRCDLGAGFSTGFSASGFFSAGSMTTAFSFRFSVSRRMSVSTCPSDSATTMRLM